MVSGTYGFPRNCLGHEYNNFDFKNVEEMWKIIRRREIIILIIIIL